MAYGPSIAAFTLIKQLCGLQSVNYEFLYQIQYRNNARSALKVPAAPVKARSGAAARWLVFARARTHCTPYRVLPLRFTNGATGLQTCVRAAVII